MATLTKKKHTGNHKMRLELLNIARIQSVRPTEKILTSSVDLNALIQASYYKEPLRLRIVNERNALERAMLHFAKIEVLSFGPMLTVLGNDKFLGLLKARLEKQIRIMPNHPQQTNEHMS